MHKLCIHGFKNLKIGKNTYISPTAKIYDNVTIGDNNKIYDDVIIYPNTIIGNNNIIHNRNIIGEIPIQSNGMFQDNDYSKTKGVKIGNNNFFHVGNLIFAGVERQTEIEDGNKLLSECHIDHDVIIYKNVTLYPRVTMAGYSEGLDCSNIGGQAFISQRKIVGQYSMVGGSQLIAKNVFPYFVYINNKITRFNTIKLPEYIKENDYERLLDIGNYFYNNKKVDKELFKSEMTKTKLDTKIYDDINIFINKLI